MKHNKKKSFIFINEFYDFDDKKNFSYH